MPRPSPFAAGLALAALLPVQPAGSATIEPFAWGYVAAGFGGAARTWPQTGPLSEPGMLHRIAPHAYADGIGAPAGADRPAPETVARELGTAPGAELRDSRPLNTLAVALGQFWISHEIALTPTRPGPEHTLRFPRPETPDAPPLRLQRAAAIGGTGPDDPREQISVTIPAFNSSNVYGSDPETAAAVRSLDGTGRLHVGPDGGLPRLPSGRALAGDPRADENIVLESLHVLFRDEHNRLARHVAAACAAQGLDCGEEEIFRLAANLNTAVQQKIFWRDYLPALLGDDPARLLPPAAAEFDIPAVLNEATTAALRFGHSQVPETVLAIVADGTRHEVPLTDCFFASDCLGDLPASAILHGARVQPAEAFDGVVTPALAEGLLLGPGQPAPEGLLGINLARGRDHGLASFETICASLGYADCAVPDHVAALYGGADTDALVGFLTEPRSPDTHLGPVTSGLLALQFDLIRRHDPNFYDLPGMFDPETLAWIEGRSFADLLAETAGLPRSLLGADLFHAPAFGVAEGPGQGTAPWRGGPPAPIPLPPTFMLLVAALATMLAVGLRRRARVA